MATPHIEPHIEQGTDEAPARVKVTVEIPVEDNKLLGRLAKRAGYNKVTMLVRAIRVLGMLEDAKADGGRIIVERSHGRSQELLLP